MKKLFTILICLTVSLGAAATNLRGKILHSDPTGSKPYANVRVDLYVWNGSQWVNMAFAITDNDGYYYFLNYDKDKKFYISVFGKYYPPQPIIILDIQPPLYQDIPTVTT